MSNDNKDDLKADHAPAMSTQISKHQLLANFVNFMAWVIVIGLLLSPLACTIQITDDTD